MQSASLEYYQENYEGVLATALSGQVHPGFRYLVNKIELIIQQHLSSGQRQAIDIGCGNGYLLSELSKRGFNSLGIDFNPDSVRVATEHFHINAQVARLEDIIALASHFDLALLVHVLEHAEDPVSLLKNIRQILNPDGILLLEIPNRDRLSINRSLRKGDLAWYEYPPHHLTFWSKAALSNALVIAGYSVIECQARPFSGEGQIGYFFRNRLRLRSRHLIVWLSSVLRIIGRALGFQGETLDAIARNRG